MRMKPHTRLRRLVQDERGFTMFFALMVLFVASLLAAGAFVAATGDIRLTGTSTSQSKAYYAALAGIDQYKYQMNVNTNYWKLCPGAANVPVPATTDESYTVKTLPSTTWAAAGHSACESEKQASIIDTAGSASGTFRIESTGFSGTCRTTPLGAAVPCSRSIVATFTHPGFLNYVFLSNYEVEDPTTISPIPTNCEHYYAARKAGGWLGECPPIPFIGEDALNGPFHTNDAVSICQEGANSPSFGRILSDAIEMNGGHYAEGGCGGTPEIKGKYTESAPTLLPPETDTELLATAERKLKGSNTIELNGNMMKITNNTTKITGPEEKFPTNGVIYVENNPTCPIKYSPFSFDKGYEEDLTCGDVYIKGTYTESLTVASQNDVIIIGNLTTSSEASSTPPGKPTGTATLGLIANNGSGSGLRRFQQVRVPARPLCTEAVPRFCQCGVPTGQPFTEGDLPLTGVQEALALERVQSPSSQLERGCQAGYRSRHCPSCPQIENGDW